MRTAILGGTGLEVSVLGFGGILLNGVEQQEASRMVEQAVNQGINFFDVGPTYGDAEEKLGPALEPFRDEVILACKTEPDLNKEQVARGIRDSLSRLKTDYFDIFQLHEVTEMSQVEQTMGSGGAMEAIIEAKEEGLIKYIGFSSHYERIALELIKRFNFDTILYPINWNNWLNKGLGRQVIKNASHRQMGIMAIKALAHRRLQENEDRIYSNTWYKPIHDNRDLARLALKFTLSRGVDLAVSPGSFEMLELALELLEEIEDFSLNDEERAKLESYADNVQPIFTK